MKRQRSSSECTILYEGEQALIEDEEALIEQMTDAEYEDYMYRTWNDDKTKSQLQREKEFCAMVVGTQELHPRPKRTQKVTSILKKRKLKD